jgi:hypothetical protein
MDDCEAIGKRSYRILLPSRIIENREGVSKKVLRALLSVWNKFILRVLKDP